MRHSPTPSLITTRKGHIWRLVWQSRRRPKASPGRRGQRAARWSRLNLMAEQNDACAVAHGDGQTTAAPGQTTPQASPQPSPASAGPGADRALVAVFASSVSGYLLRYAADAGYRCLLVDPDPARASGARMAGFTVADAIPDNLDVADVVVTDHHRDELGVMLRDALAAKARWVGIMGNPHHA